MNSPPTGRGTEVRVSTGAIERNCQTVLEVIGGESELCAVVKADAYGHGVVEATRAVLRGGASRLAVATAAEAIEIRELVSEAAEVPLLVMGSLGSDEVEPLAGIGADVGVWTTGFLELCERVGAERGVPVGIHIKHDTGMGRLGTSDAEAVNELIEAAARSSDVELAGVWTHFATADDPEDPYGASQLERFSSTVAAARALQPGCLVHAANSGAAFALPESRFDFVRCGISLYGLSPFGEDARDLALEPAMTIVSRISAIKEVEAGDSIGYGRKWTADEPTRVAICPVGYGDGYRRGFSGKADVLVGGERRPVIGAISMDNLAVDLGADSSASVGDEVVLLGAQGPEEITAQELAEHLETINYEIVTGVGVRIPREYSR